MARDQKGCVEDSELEELRNHPLMQEILSDLSKQTPERVEALVAMLAEIEEEDNDRPETDEA